MYTTNNLYAIQNESGSAMLNGLGQIALYVSFESAEQYIEKANLGDQYAPFPIALRTTAEDGAVVCLDQYTVTASKSER